MEENTPSFSSITDLNQSCDNSAAYCERPTSIPSWILGLDNIALVILRRKILAGKHPTELFESDALEDCGTTISLWSGPKVHCSTNLEGIFEHVRYGAEILLPHRQLLTLII